MFIERLCLTNFRCFGPKPQTITLDQNLTAFVGNNGAGKTATMQALLRMFGTTAEHRRIRRQDFHVPANETISVRERKFTVEAILFFPEADSVGNVGAIPEFFSQMATDEAGKLKCRLRLEATWTDDGSADGAIDFTFQAVRTFGVVSENDCFTIKANDRARIQMIYIPALRDGASQVTEFLRGRLWRAVSWSDQVRLNFESAGKDLKEQFCREQAVGNLTAELTRRWQEVHSANTDTTPAFRPFDLRVEDIIRKVAVSFSPDEGGRERGLEELSDGQRSLFHLAMTAAILDIEAKMATGAGVGFQADRIAFPSLTLIALEEPENNLAPFYLSRIIHQLIDLASGQKAQAVVASHAPGILARLDPTQVRHFRLEPKLRTAVVHSIHLPDGLEEESKFVREAVRTYPELYFARFVILGEGASEEVVLPRLAEAMNLPIDRSFVAMVPLGGRHVNHLWRLLADLDIPYATLLDLDLGRHGGGYGRIKYAITQLLNIGHRSCDFFGIHLDQAGIDAKLTTFDNTAPPQIEILNSWLTLLQSKGIFFSYPLDLDFSMMKAYSNYYQKLEPGMDGPNFKSEPMKAVFGEDGDSSLFSAEDPTYFYWYRYLFLGRGKPSTHVRILAAIPPKVLKEQAQQELRALLNYVSARLAIPAA